MENMIIEELDDSRLEKRIQEVVPEGLARVYVIVKDEHVFLSGEAKDLDTKNRIEASVLNLAGVRSVTNHIRLDDLEDESYRLLEKSVLKCPFKGADLRLS